MPPDIWIRLPLLLAALAISLVPLWLAIRLCVKDPLTILLLMTLCPLAVHLQPIVLEAIGRALRIHP